MTEVVHTMASNYSGSFRGGPQGRDKLDLTESASCLYVLSIYLAQEWSGVILKHKLRNQLRQG